MALITIAWKPASERCSVVFIRCCVLEILLSEDPCAAKQGTIIIRHKQQQIVKHTLEGQPVLREVSEPVVLHEDLIQPEFWQQHPTVLG